MGGLTTVELDRFAETYYLAADQHADVPIEELQQELSIDRLADAVAGCERVLELGYGTGLTCRELRRRGVGLEMLEGSPLLAEAARQAHPGMPVHEGLFETWAPREPLDAVLALHVLEHVDDPLALLGHLRGWLRPGGRVVVVVPNAESLHRRLAVDMGLQPHLDSLSARDELVGHQRVYTLDGLRRDAELAGFRVTGELGWFLKTLPNSMMLDWSPELLTALAQIDLPPRMLANIGIVAERGDD